MKPLGGVDLDLTVPSCDGTMYFGFVAARNAVPEASALAVALQAACDELVAKMWPAPPTAGRARPAPPRPAEHGARR